MLRVRHEELLARRNEPVEWGNGIYEKYKYPIITADHVPLEWKYDFDERDNPSLMQRIMMNATLNSGAIKWQGKYVLVVRVEGADRKSFFAVAESPNGVDNFRFWPGRQRRRQALPVPKTLSTGSGCPTLKAGASSVMWCCIRNS